MTSSHTLREVLDIVALPRAAVMGLIAAGVVAPSRGSHGEYRFGFRDLVVLRTAAALRRSNVSAGRVKESLLRTKALESDPASTSLCAEGRHVVARADGREWQAETGQMRFQLSEPTNVGEVVAHGRADAYRHYEAGRLHERHARNREAEKSYRAALKLDPTLHAAWVDLSALLCDCGDSGEALRILAEARLRFPESTALLFNQALAFEDVGDCIGAQRAYQDCIALDPLNADAHFNLGRLFDCAGRAQDALRHYNQYRMITS
ncbi:tetratricopeptide repeat protein [Cupriavidus plantarum]|uniref:tetratricopeptide repeat protein n=1 Tax=Cupriavidus plantarum TaxID=942865 RepID=UPI0015C778EE|nr:tetratricopeptide repeat protein [Cupriavidus plantarum]NYI02725.1 tetratricopeptide (TPR) repeat protein [Cupriavidus plantarum]